MTKFIKRSALFILPVMLAMILLDYFVTAGLRKTAYGYYRGWNELFDGKINADLLILGSSRAKYHFSPEILDSVLSVNSYNFGMNGYRLNMQIGRFRLYEKYNKTPGTIIISLDIRSLTQRRNLHLINQFLPYLWDDDIKKLTRNYEGFSFADYWVPAYRYLTMRKKKPILIGILEYFHLKHYINNSYKGFHYNDVPWDGRFDKFEEANPNGVRYEAEEASINLLESFLKECRDNNIFIILAYSPEYIQGQRLENNRGEILSIYDVLADKYGFPFLDYSQDRISYEKQYFYNSTHLNKRGAELFSLKLAADIDSVFSSQNGSEQ